MERMAANFIPTVMPRGFYSGPVFGTFRAAIAHAKVMNLDANTIHGAIAHCVNLAVKRYEREKRASIIPTRATIWASCNTGSQQTMTPRSTRLSKI